MSAYVWKIKVVKKGQGDVAIGMDVDIIVKNTTAKPSNDTISKAINEKYGIKSHPGTISNWITVEKG